MSQPAPNHQEQPSFLSQLGCDNCWGRTPLITRFLLIECLIGAIAGMWVTRYTANCPVIIIETKGLEFYRLFLSPFFDLSILSGIFACLWVWQEGQRLESKRGSVFTILTFGLTYLLSNLMLLVLVGVFGYGAGSEWFLYQCAAGMWGPCFGWMALDCYSTPEGQRKLFCCPCDIPSRVYPWVLVIVFELMIGWNLSMPLGVLCGILMAYQSDRLLPGTVGLVAMERNKLRWMNGWTGFVSVQATGTIVPFSFGTPQQQSMPAEGGGSGGGAQTGGSGASGIRNVRGNVHGFSGGGGSSAGGDEESGGGGGGGGQPPQVMAGSGSSASTTAAAAPSVFSGQGYRLGDTARSGSTTSARSTASSSAAASTGGAATGGAISASARADRLAAIARRMQTTQPKSATTTGVVPAMELVRSPTHITASATTATTAAAASPSAPVSNRSPGNNNIRRTSDSTTGDATGLLSSSSTSSRHNELDPLEFDVSPQSSLLGHQYVDSSTNVPDVSRTRGDTSTAALLPSFTSLRSDSDANDSSSGNSYAQYDTRAYADAIRRLCAMGYSKQDALEAIAMCGGDAEEAIKMLQQEQ